MEVNLHNGMHLGLTGMNLLDWLIVMVLALSTVTAFMTGLIRSVLSLVGLVAGVLAAGWYAPRLAESLKPWISPLALAEIVSFAVILLAVYLLAALLGRLLRGACKAVGLGFMDRLGGAAFGMVRGVLLLAALLLPAAPLIRNLTVTQNSALLPYLLPAAHAISFVLPHDFGLHLAKGGWTSAFGLLQQRPPAVTVR